MEPHYYQVNLEWKEGRLGEISSPELNHSIEIATPPQFASGIEGVWSPEHLLTAAVNSCFMTTFLSIAENSKLEFTHFSCDGEGKLEQIEGKFYLRIFWALTWFEAVRQVQSSNPQLKS